MSSKASVHGILFIKTPKWKSPKSSSNIEWNNKMQYLLTTDYLHIEYKQKKLFKSTRQMHVHTTQLYL